MSPESETEGPEIYKPLGKLDKCSVCQKTDEKLRWCSSCGEILYCSPECQKSDWKRHKRDCGQTDRIELETFFPLIAGVAQGCRLHSDACTHPALLHKILNSPNPGSTEDIVPLPNGTSARLLLLGEKIDQSETSSPKWWPTAVSPQVRSKLFRRILAEGLLLPIVLSTTMALVGEMYTTTAIPASQPSHYQFTGRRRVRLQYNRCPIADIGIAKGTCTRVTGQDRLSYYNMDTGEFLMGQDPTDHYWIYFTTLDGHEYFVDCGMFTFNFSSVVQLPKESLGLPPLDLVPGFFYDKGLEKALPTTTGRIGWNPDQRFSILRHEELDTSIRRREEYCQCHDTPVMFKWLDKIAGRTCTTWEKEMFLTFFENSSIVFRLNLKNQTYLNFAKKPSLGFELDPDETLDINPDQPGEEEELYQYLKKCTRRLHKGQISAEQWNKAFNRWKERPHDERMRMSGMTESDRKGKGKKHGSTCGQPEKKPIELSKPKTAQSGKAKAKEDSESLSDEMRDRMHALGGLMAKHDFLNAKAYLNDKQAGKWREV